MSFSYSHLDSFSAANNLYQGVKADIGKFCKDFTCKVNFVKEVASGIFTMVKEKPAITVLGAASLISMSIADNNQNGEIIDVLVPFTTSLVCGYGAFSLLNSQAQLKISEAKIQELEQFKSLRIIGTDQSYENSISDLFMQKYIQLNAPEGEDTRDVAFVVFPKKDDNQAFSLKHPQNQFNMITFTKKYRVEWVRAETVSEITQSMEKVNKQISVLWLQMHGSPALMVLSDHTDGLLDKASITDKTFPNLTPSARALMSSCSSGKEEGVAQHISTLYPNVVVEASSEDVCEETLYFSNGIPSLLSLTESGEDCTVRFLTCVEGN